MYIPPNGYQQTESKEFKVTGDAVVSQREKQKVLITPNETRDNSVIHMINLVSK